MGTIESDMKRKTKLFIGLKCLRPVKTRDIMYGTRCLCDSLRDCGNEAVKHIFSTGWLHMITTLSIKSYCY